jgi:two-component system, OmpR family, response regulator VicR
MILEKENYEVIATEDGQSALEIAASSNPDLVISDGLLPKMHGFLVCKALKEFAKPPKVVLLTGVYTKVSYKWEVKSEYGADDILTKPFNKEGLIACIEKHLLANVDVAAAEMCVN